MPGAAQIQLTPQQQEELDRRAGSRSLAARAVERAKIMLGLAAGKAKQEIAAQLGIARQTAWRWERRFREQGMPAGLEDTPRSGRPRVIPPEKIEQIVRKTIQETPPDSTHWKHTEPGRAGGRERLLHRPDLAGPRFEAVPGAYVQVEQ
jgi:transposase